MGNAQRNLSCFIIANSSHPDAMDSIVTIRLPTSVDLSGGFMNPSDGGVVNGIVMAMRTKLELNLMLHGMVSLC